MEGEGMTMYHLKLMAQDCGPLAGRAADLLDLERDNEILFDLVLRSFAAGWRSACIEMRARAETLNAADFIAGLDQAIAPGGVDMGPGPLAAD